jgi:hypothetical protein
VRVKVRKSKCYGCDALATKELRGFGMCVTHYAEALEHGADFGNDFTGVPLYPAPNKPVTSIEVK